MKKIKRSLIFILCLIVALSCFDTRAFAEPTPADGEYAAEDEEYVAEDYVALDQEWLTAERVMGDNTYTSDVEADGTIRITLTEIKGNLNLPDAGVSCSSISWASYNESVIALDGAITQPSYLEANGEGTTVTLAAILSYGDAMDEKSFIVTVPPLAGTEEERNLIDDCKAINIFISEGGNTWARVGDLYTNIPLPPTTSILDPYYWGTVHGSTVTWTSGNTDLLKIPAGSGIDYLWGEVKRPSCFVGYRQTTLTARVSQSDTVYKDIVYNVNVRPAEPNDEESIILTKNWLTEELVLNGNSSSSAVYNDLNLPTKHSLPSDTNWKVCTISWASSDPDIITTAGNVIRPSDEPQNVTLTATIKTESGYSGTKEFTFTVTPIESKTLTLKFDDFNDAGDLLQVNGGASMDANDSGALEFINHRAGGSVFTQNRIRLNDDLSFSTFFTFVINADANWGHYGDGGFTFTLQPVGSSIYSVSDDTNSLGIEGVKPSVSIAFDTRYWKEENANTGSQQTTVYHDDRTLGVFVNGECDSLLENEQYSTPYHLYTKFGSVYGAWIEYDGEAKTLEIRIADSEVRPLNATYALKDVDLKQLLAVDNDLTVDQVQDMYAGFTGSAGDMRTEWDEIRYWCFNNDSDPINFGRYDYTDTSVVTVSAEAGANAGDCILTAKVTGRDGSTPVAGMPVEFFTSAGTLISNAAITDSAGEASVAMHAEISSPDIEVMAVAESGMTGSVIFELALAPQDVLDYDAQWLTDSVILNGNSSLDHIIDDLYLPTEGQAIYNDGSGGRKSAVSWTSSNTDYLGDDGTVTNPAPETGDQTVTLSAIISLDSESVSKEFTVTIKTLVTDIVNAVSAWLDTYILDGQNSALNNITANLSLPTAGQYGTAISWSSSDVSIVSTGGAVTRPGFAVGDKDVVLTAKISKDGSGVTSEIEIPVTVKALDATDLEMIAADMAWLTEGAILNENESLDSVTSGLSLPTAGQNGCTIVWTSSDESAVSTSDGSDGMVTRPPYKESDRTVLLTAKLTYGTESSEKPFQITVLKQDATGAELFADDVNWLNASLTLGENLSQYSICENLSLPSSAPNGSVITWVSSDTAAINVNGAKGVVKRPEYDQPSVTLTLTATITGYSDTATKTIEYTVLAKPDIYAPQVVSCNPAQGAAGIAYDKKTVTVTFDENIQWGTASGNDGITLSGTNAPSITSRIEGKDLIITLSDVLAGAAKYDLVIPCDAVTDPAGNPIQGNSAEGDSTKDNYTLSFITENVTKMDIVVSSTTPTDKDKQVSAGSPISFSFTYSDGSTIDTSNKLSTGSAFQYIALNSRDGKKVNITAELSGNTVTVSPVGGETLAAGEVYSLSIPEGAVNDRFRNRSAGKTVQFAVQSSDVKPEIADIYPTNGQTGVNVNQNITVTFSKDVEYRGTGTAFLRDGKNAIREIDAYSLNAKQWLLDPRNALQPNTSYTLIIEDDFVKDASYNAMDFDYMSSFTTGTNALEVTGVSPLSTNDDFYRAPINAVIEISFSTSASESGKASDITIKDSSGTPVTFSSAVSGSKAVLTPSSPLKANQAYTVSVPGGAYQGSGGAVNDAIVFRFVTASEALHSFDTFTVSPSTNWIVKKAMTFKMDSITRILKNAGRTIKSFSWNFGDGITASDANPTHTYAEAGSYDVTLTVKDNYGFSYEITRAITIGDFESGSVSMSVSKEYISDWLTVDDSTQGKYVLYTISLAYGGVFITDEKISVQLYKKGELVKSLGSVITGKGSNWYTDAWGYKHYDYGTACFPFFYGDNDYFGTYELVFTLGDSKTGKTVRVPVTIVNQSSTQPLLIQLYDPQDNTYYETSERLWFYLDGKMTEAKKKWYDENYGNCYVINDVKLGDHTLRFTTTSNDIGLTYDTGWPIGFQHKEGLPQTLIIKKSTPGISSIASNDTNTAIYKNYFKNVDRPDTEFTVYGDWGNLKSGYYEYKISGPDGDRYSKSFPGPSVSINVPSMLREDERLYFRMVSTLGTASGWKDAKVRVVPAPETPVSYNNATGDYEANTSFELKELLGETPNIFEDIPFLGDNENLIGLSDSMFTVTSFNVGGKSQFIKYQLPEAGAEMISAGFDFPVKVSGTIILEYNDGSEKWEFYYGYITLKRDFGIKSFEKKVKVVGLTAKGELNLSTAMGATLVLNEGADDVDYQYAGIIYFNPHMEATLQVGTDDFNATGYVNAGVEGQLHTTGYMSVEATVYAGVTAKFYYYTKTLYEKELVNKKWNNNSTPVVTAVSAAPGEKIAASLFAPDTLDELYLAPVEIMGRDYLDRGSEWTGRPAAFLRSMKAAANAEAETLEEGVYPDSEVKLVRSGDGLYMIWPDDNPDRTSMNRTQMKVSVRDSEGNWSEPVWIDTDETADFSPSASVADDGVLIAWQDMGISLPESAEADDFAKNAEISVTETGLSKGNGQPEIVTLTDDDQYDHSPRLAASGSNALLVWTKSEGLNGMSVWTGGDAGTEDTDSLYYSIRNGEGWSVPSEIEGSLPAVADSSLVMNGSEGLLFYTLDSDNDFLTTADQEVFAREYSDGLWGDAVQLTDNDICDANPKAVYINGDWFITWYHDGGVMYQTGLSGTAAEASVAAAEESGAAEAESGAAIGSDYEIAADDKLVALVYTKMGEDNTRPLSALFYDVDKGMWSDEALLTDGEGVYAKSFSPAFTDDGTLGILSISYTQAEMITESVDGVEYQNPSNQVELKNLDYTPTHDLALDPEAGLALDTAIPLPETMDTVTVTILNQGDFAENAAVTLYDGDPANGGTLAAKTAADVPVPAHSSRQAEIQWVVGSDGKDEYELYAAVKPDDSVTESDESNNTVCRVVSAADAEIADLECENPANDNYFMKATVRNSGSKILTGVSAALKNGETIVNTRTINELYPGEAVCVSMLFSSKSLTINESGKIDMTLEVSAAGANDNSPDNNSYDFTLEPAVIFIDQSDPCQGDTKADVNKAITVTFSMDVSEGTNFGQIKLADSNLNAIGTTGVIAGDTLTLTPQRALDYDTDYTLTIPVDAVGDSYGHAMEEDFTISFNTETSGPEVILAYPGDGLDGAPVDGEIKMKYNQNVAKGPSFNSVTLRADSKAVSAAVNTDGEWLFVDPAGSLATGTEYVVEIPAGAVVNSANEIQTENFKMDFITEGTKVDPSGSDSHRPDKTPTLAVTHLTLDDGSTMAVVSIGNDYIMAAGSAGSAMATIDVTEETANDAAVQVSLTEEAENLLISGKVDLRIITGKGEIIIPAAWFGAAHEQGKNSIALMVAQTSDDGATNGLVSNGSYDFTLTAGNERITRLGQDFTITIPLDLSKIQNAKRVIAYTYDEASGAWQPLGGIVGETGLTFGTNHFSAFAAFETPKSFNDVTSAWAKGDVEILASRSLISGTSDSTFNPEGNITRAEFTALIVRSLYTELSGNKGTFADVPADAWYADITETAYSLGLAGGTGAGKFSPNANITREQLAVLAYRLYQYKNRTVDGSTESTFADSRDISQYAKEAVSFAQNTGILKGSGGMFYPRRNTTRQEAAVVLYRLLEYMGEI